MSAAVSPERLAELLANLPPMITEPGRALVDDALAIAVATDRLLRRMHEWQSAVTLYRDWAGCEPDAEQNAVWTALPGDAAWTILDTVAAGIGDFGSAAPAVDLNHARTIAAAARQMARLDTVEP